METNCISPALLFSFLLKDIIMDMDVEVFAGGVRDHRRAEALMAIYEDIQETLFRLSVPLKAIKASRPAKVENILSLAERLSYSAFAPIGWKEGFPLHGKFPPAPQPDQMHSGKLTEYNKLHSQTEDIVPITTDSEGSITASTVDASFVALLRARAADAVKSIQTVENPENVEEPTAMEISQPTKKARTRMNLTFDVMDSDDD